MGTMSADWRMSTNGREQRIGGRGGGVGRLTMMWEDRKHIICIRIPYRKSIHAVNLACMRKESVGDKGRALILRGGSIGGVGLLII